MEEFYLPHGCACLSIPSRTSIPEDEEEDGEDTTRHILMKVESSYEERVRHEATACRAVGQFCTVRIYPHASASPLAISAENSVRLSMLVKGR